jgi:hypothetical protein
MLTGYPNNFEHCASDGEEKPATDKDVLDFLLATVTSPNCTPLDRVNAGIALIAALKDARKTAAFGSVMAGEVTKEIETVCQVLREISCDETVNTPCRVIAAKAVLS